MSSMAIAWQQLKLISLANKTVSLAEYLCTNTSVSVSVCVSVAVCVGVVAVVVVVSVHTLHLLTISSASKVKNNTHNWIDSAWATIPDRRDGHTHPTVCPVTTSNRNSNLRMRHSRQLPKLIARPACGQRRSVNDSRWLLLRWLGGSMTG